MLLFNNIFLIYIIYLKFIITLPIFEVHRIVINDNITFMDKASYQFSTKGMMLTFDPNLNFSLIPIQIENEIKNGFYSIIEFSEPYEKDIGNGYQVLVTHIFDPICFPAVNFILADKAITIPNKYLFKKTDIYEFIFLMKENQDKIILGKDLIDLMKIEFINENDFIIHNKDFQINIID